MTTIARDWDRHVEQAEEIARGAGFRALRDRILAAAEPRPGDEVADLGSGTGLLTLALAPDVKRVWAIDISPSMGEYLETKAAGWPATAPGTRPGAGSSQRDPSGGGSLSRASASRP